MCMCTPEMFLCQSPECGEGSVESAKKKLTDTNNIYNHFTYNLIYKTTKSFQQEQQQILLLGFLFASTYGRLPVNSHSLSSHFPASQAKANYTVFFPLQLCC